MGEPMPSRLADFLKSNLTQIVERFVAEVQREGIPPGKVGRAQLVDHVPVFLREVAAELEREGADRVTPDAIDSSEAARLHGENRWWLGYDIEGLVREYGCLRQTIFSLMQEQGVEPKLSELEVLSKYLNVGVGEAIRIYVEHRDRELNARREELSFLTEAGEVLMSSLDLQGTLRRLTRLLVPRLADWCSVQVRGVFSADEILVAHVEPEDEAALRELYQRLPPPKDWAYGYPFARNEGEVQLGVVGTDARAATADEASAEFLASIDAGSWMVLPIKVEQATIGAIVLVRRRASPPFAAEDRPLAEELSRRAALAIDNARLYQRAQAERQRVERALRAKDEFVAVISHELRTPLNSILGWLTLLRTGTLPADRVTHALEVVERNAKAQARIVEDLLDISRLATGNTRIQVAQLDLSSVVEMVLENVRPAAEAKRLVIESSIERSNTLLRGDSQRLQQVVWNLVTNAIKFTPKDGTIRVTLRRHRSQLELVVEDTGEGIAPEFLPHVFELFNQADSSYTRRHGGLGLGLTIVKHLVELHGGTIDAMSPGPGQGATFRVRLPVSPAVSLSLGIPRFPTNGSEDVPTLPVALKGKAVLIVDDDPDARELVATILQAAGADVTAAASVKEAFDLLSGFRPDVIVTDIGMPEADGFALLKYVRNLVEGDPPVLALSGRASEDDRTLAIVAGFKAYMTKPVEPSALVTMIAELARPTPKPEPTEP